MAGWGTLSEKQIAHEMNRSQRRFLAALVTCRTVRDAAKCAGINEATAWRYLQDPALKQDFAEHKAAILGHTSRRLATETGAAMDVLVEIILHNEA